MGALLAPETAAYRPDPVHHSGIPPHEAPVAAGR